MTVLKADKVFLKVPVVLPGHASVEAIFAD